MRGIFDSHCHYDSAGFDADRYEILDELMGSGSSVTGLMHAATDEASIRFGIETAARYEGFYTSIGFHPECCDTLPKDPKRVLTEALGTSDKIAAIGEVGLDYHFEGYDRDLQIKLLRMQIELAAEYDLPLIFHCRDATADFLALMQEYKPKGVVHCFSGSAETARELLSLGLYLGFGGVLTFKNAKKVKNSFMAVPEDRFMFETDCPYLAPEPYRGQRCDSRMIANIAEYAGELRNTDPQRLLDISAENIKRLFKLK
ncbi:MAG: TatD family hydrolase [Ruminococcus sp.]|nr:TatD family hydrolase [Ruminococcus sp.]